MVVDWHSSIYTALLAVLGQAWGQINYLFLVTYQEHPPGETCWEIPLGFPEGKLETRLVLWKNQLLYLLVGTWWPLSPPARLTSGRAHTLSRVLHRKALAPPVSRGLDRAQSDTVCQSTVGRPIAESCHQPRPKSAIRATQLSTVFLSQAAQPATGPQKPRPWFYHLQ